MAGNLIVAFASFFTVLSIEMVFISFATEHWIDIVVNREKIQGKVDPFMFKTDLRYFTRYRGLFLTCFPGNETAFLDDKKYDDDRVDGSCLIERGYEWTRDPDTSDYGSDYTTRIHLMRSHLAFFVLALLLSVVSLVTGGIGCFKESKVDLYVTALFMFMSVVFIAAGEGSFHGYEYLEKNKIQQDPFPAKYLEESKHAVLKGNSTTGYGYSYILGWLGMPLALTAAVLFLRAAYVAPASSKAFNRQRDDD